MNADELEHAACSPTRFAASIRGAGPIAEPYQRTLSLYTGSHEIESLHLVPGGRFLLVEHSNARVDLMDLGYMSNVLLESEPIASLFEMRGKVQSVQPTGDGLSITFITIRPQ